MLASQDGLCAICRCAPAEHVDHDHETGAVRALLCFGCNGGLGQFRDEPDVLRAAAEYVEFHKSRQAAAVDGSTGSNPATTHSRPGAPPVGSGRRPSRASIPYRRLLLMFREADG